MDNEEYIRIRKAEVELNKKILKTQKKEMVGTSAKLLGMMGDDDVIVMEEEDDINIVMDFSYCEAIHNGKTGVIVFFDTKPSLSCLEKELCNALLRSYTSFFRVKDTIPKDGIITLWNLLNNKEIQLKDINLSKTVFPGLFLFCRILEWKGMNMTSGIGFIFTKFSEQALLRQYRRDLRKVRYPNESAARFIAAYRMKLVFGVPMEFTDIC